MTTPQVKTSKLKTPIFAYLRRSTKDKQEVSLENQADNIDLIIKDNGFSKDDVVFFEESRSAYDGIKQRGTSAIVRKRIEFDKMLKAIDQSNIPCIILVRDSSRLSRNQIDNIEIQKRLFGIYGNQNKIQKIIFYGGEFWTKDSDRIIVDNCLAKNYHESITTGARSQNGVIAQLRRGYFVYNPPFGLNKIKKGTAVYLERNDKISFVKRAFEMKIEGYNHKKICEYLQKEGGYKIDDKHLTERIFNNTIYIGTYTHPTVGEIFEGLQFLEGEPPISKELWNKTQNVLGKKKSRYGELQEGDILGDKLRTPNGRRMSRYFAKDIYIQYTNAIEKIYIAERAILEGFIDQIKIILESIMFQHFLIYANDVRKAKIDTKIRKEDAIKRGKKALKEMGKSISDFHKPVIDNELGYSGEEKEKLKAELEESFLKELGEGLILDEMIAKEDGKGDDWFLEAYDMWKSASYKTFAEGVEQKESINLHSLYDVQKEEIRKLQKAKLHLEEVNNNATSLVADGTISKENYTKLIEKNAMEVSLIDERIADAEKTGELQQYLDRLPEVLQKTFELASRVDQKKEIKDMRDEIIKLIQITTFELEINNKKELKIKLYDVLTSLFFGNKSLMEPLAGIEPATAPLPWACSTTEPQWQKIFKLRGIGIKTSVSSSNFIFSIFSPTHKLYELTEYKVFSKNSSFSRKNFIFRNSYKSSGL
ncbi:MAG: hypothetical protein HHAS10_09040 [Candidatus Altimarinota bacterium]